MTDSVNFSKLKRIYKEKDCFIFINGRSSLIVISGVIGIIIFYGVLVLNNQYSIANIIAILFAVFFVQSACTYTVSSIDKKNLFFNWEKKVLGFSIRRKSGELLEDFDLFVHQVTEYDSGNAYVFDLRSDGVELRVFDLEKKVNLWRVLEFLESNGVPYKRKE